MTIYFGPAGLGPVKEAVENLNKYSRLGLRACEIAFTYGIYIKKQVDIDLIKDTAKKLDIRISIHSPYFVNLNSKDKIKIKNTKQRILDCARIGDKLGAEVVVFHPGYYEKMNIDQSFENIKANILDMQDTLKQENIKTKIAPETMGKVNVFGSIEEISRLAKETKTAFCIDFAHILARYKKVDYDLINDLFKEHKHWHCHFSGIEYTDKGERNHIKTPKESWIDLLKNLPKDKDITIINESPDMVNDSVEGLKLAKQLSIQ